MAWLVLLCFPKLAIRNFERGGEFWGREMSGGGEPRALRELSCGDPAGEDQTASSSDQRNGAPRTGRERAMTPRSNGAALALCRRRAATPAHVLIRAERLHAQF